MKLSQTVLVPNTVWFTFTGEYHVAQHGTSQLAEQIYPSTTEQGNEGICTTMLKAWLYILGQTTHG